jgi:hypothetical protein
MNNHSVIVLTGGPGGGKSTLIEELSRDPVWRGRFAALPEAISLMGGLGISLREKRFQRVMVQMQLAMEDGLAHALGPEDQRILLCHRGSLDPLAYWLDRGWPEQEFFEYTQATREEHYQRYAAVIHLVTAADGAIEHYKKYPQAHRPETPQQAIHLGQLLQQVWDGHPRYFQIDNKGCDWSAKAQKARAILAELYGEI